MSEMPNLTAMDLKSLQNSLKVCLMYPEFDTIAGDIEAEILKRIRSIIGDGGRIDRV